jgi:flagellar basal body P-ring protein FlgI
VPRNSIRFIFVSIAILAISGMAGCSQLWNRSKSKKENAELKKLMEVPTPPPTIGLATRPMGLEPLLVKGVSAVNSLPGTGGAADPSPDRDALLEEMKRHNVANPEKFLEGNTTALVLVQATIPAGARRGDAIDVQVISPENARAKDLAGGWLLDTRMTEQLRVRGSAFTGPSVRKGDTMALATGLVLTQAGYESASQAQNKLEGIVIDGGRVQKDRPLHLGIARSFAHAKVASAIADAINLRYFFFDGSSRHGIATAISDDSIEIEVPPRYRESVPRLMASISAIAIDPRRRESQAYLQEITERLQSPSSAASAALAAEALGEPAVPALLAALKSDNREIRFYAAESLAYLDRVEAIEPMRALLSEVPAFRFPGFQSLIGMKNPEVADMLTTLLDHESLETRYAAVVTLRKRNSASPLIQGQKLGTFAMYRVGSPESSPAVIGSLRDVPEIVITGQPVIQIPTFLRIETGVLAKPLGKDKIEIHHFSITGEDRHVEADATAADFVVGLARAGCHYQQVVEMLRLAKDEGALKDQFVMDPLPRPLRTYFRDDDTAIAASGTENPN